MDENISLKISFELLLYEPIMTVRKIRRFEIQTGTEWVRVKTLINLDKYSENRMYYSKISQKY